MAAAVADYRPAAPRADKIKKDEPARNWSCGSSVPRTCSPRSPPRRRPGQLLVGFAAETGAGAIEYGRGKLERKGLDAVVVNDVGRAGHRLRRAPTTRSRSSRRTASAHVPRATKAEVAARSWTRS